MTKQFVYARAVKSFQDIFHTKNETPAKSINT